MAGNDYEFVTRWRIRSTTEEVYDILGDALDLVRWWPSVYLKVEELSPGDDTGIGKIISLFTKGWLPYTIRWQFRVSDAQRPQGFSLEASGDLDGRGVWRFKQVDEWTNITYEWKIRADKPLFKYLSPLLKPLFSANHRWAMAKGEESLKLEIARRNAVTEEERALLPSPPGPTPTSLLPFLVSLITPARRSKPRNLRT